MSKISPLIQQAPTNPTSPPPGGTPQTPVENPLDKLRDIHLPESIDQFPYAPGWWILLAIFLIITGVFWYRHYQYKKATRLIKPARKELAQLRDLPQEAINANAIASLSALLKRVCLIYYPKTSVASITSENWLSFLNQQALDIQKSRAQRENVYFTEQQVKLFSQLPYQKDARLEIKLWNELLDASENCIVQIIQWGAKNRKAVNA